MENVQMNIPVVSFTMEKAALKEFGPVLGKKANPQL